MSSNYEHKEELFLVKLIGKGNKDNMEVLKRSNAYSYAILFARESCGMLVVGLTKSIAKHWIILTRSSVQKLHPMQHLQSVSTHAIFCLVPLMKRDHYALLNVSYIALPSNMRNVNMNWIVCHP